MGKREIIMKWMDQHQCGVLALQETWSSHSSTEKHGHYTWFFSSDKEGKREHHGVGFVIHKSVMKSIIMVKPISSRLMMIKIRATPELDIISAYGPTAAAEET